MSDWLDEFNSDYTENKEMKFIWGLISCDDISASKPNLLTMNDIDLIYLKDEKKYILEIETIYYFNGKQDKKNYLQYLLDNFTDWMIDNKYNTDLQLNPYGDFIGLFSEGININTRFDTIEDAYRTFYILVNGYLTIN
jgi:hypothetical protein